jgi:hypothetical protein
MHSLGSQKYSSEEIQSRVFTICTRDPQISEAIFPEKQDNFPDLQIKDRLLYKKGKIVHERVDTIDNYG